ncbi:alpha-L-fucosidase [Zobellia sp. B3R18]|uniref:alpha-L-fucosidase n=1 Tax=Zobellia sp. B3R18 TaxID=2841568 RepID=UPI001C071EE6|nr:alpha-L-fucosidase [Zobellia sp. B3R18]MBU2975758.1 alpha-L-fucosidase [Zobellia sp. B3R18]
MKKTVFILIAILLSLPSCLQAQEKNYEPAWNSLRNHHTPEWLVDAKFGIYCHWGIQTISYEKGKEDWTNEQLLKQFKGENFNADEWAKLFETAGAKFGGVIGWHGSDLKHWNSDISDYNTAKVGPKIDIVGEVFKAVRKRNMRTLVSYHSIEGDEWIDFAKEGVDKYDPDIFWVDASFGGTKGSHNKKVTRKSKFIGEGTLPSPVFEDKYQREFISYFFKKSIERKKEVEFVYKSNDIPPSVGMRDLENGILTETAYDVWMTDMDMTVPPDFPTHGWFYREGIPMRSTNELVDMLMDVISKNGVLLLNIPPKSDGTFPAEVVQNLTQMGKWLEKNGEAVYNTAPWFIYGEGPTDIDEGNYTYHHNNHFAQVQYTKEDIRFTVNGNNLYATCLGKPNGDLLIKSLNSSFKLRKDDIQKVVHLSTNKPVQFNHDEKGLELKLNEVTLDESANVFKITLN